MADKPDTLPDEIWKPVVGWEGLYEVSDRARVRTVGGFRNFTNRVFGSCQRWQPAKMRKIQTDTNGYRSIVLHKNGIATNCLIHRLVCEAFRGAPPSGKHEVAHSDGNKLNNGPGNLRWATKLENEADRIKHGNTCRGEKAIGAKLNEAKVRTIRLSRESHRTLAKKFMVSESLIRQVRARNVWKHVE